MASSGAEEGGHLLKHWAITLRLIVSVYCAWSCACLFCMYNLVFNVYGENGGHTKHWESDKHVGSNSFQKISKAKVHFRRLYLCPTIFTWLSLLVRNFLLYINQYMVSTPFYKARSTTSELPIWIACPNCMLYMSKFSEIYANFSSSSLFFLPSFLSFEVPPRLSSVWAW